MSTIITADNGVEFEVCSLGIAVVNHEEETETWARLSDAQRVELAAALDPGRRGLHVRLDNQAKTLATLQRERDAAVARAEQAENARDTAATRAAQLEKALAASRDAHQRSADAHMEWKDRAEKAEGHWKRWECKADQRDELLIRVEDERDAAVARAEQAERELAALRGRVEDIIPGTEVIHAAWNGEGIGRVKFERELGVQCLIRDRVLAAIEAEAVVDPVEAKARVEADRRYSGDPNHAFIEGAVWAARHVLGGENAV